MDDCLGNSDGSAQVDGNSEQGSLAKTRQECSTGEIPPCRGVSSFGQAPIELTEFRFGFQMMWTILVVQYFDLQFPFFSTFLSLKQTMPLTAPVACMYAILISL